MTQLADPQGQVSGALSINDSGQVAGTAYDNDGTASAVLWTNGAPVLLAGLSGQVESFARGINASGLVAAESVTANGSRAVLLTADTAVDIGVLAGFEGAYANGLNNLGAVVGASYDAAGNRHAFVWSGGTMTDIGALAPAMSSYAFGINDSGAVVGQSDSLGAFLYEGGQLLDLDGLVDNLGAWSLDVAYAINAQGQIVGTGTIDGVSRAFLLTPDALTDPVPEPGEWAMIAAGLLVAGGIARRRAAR